MKVILFVGKNSVYLDEEIKKISQKFKTVFADSSKNFFLEFEKLLNKNLFEGSFDIVIKNIEKLKEQDIKRVVFLIKNKKNYKFIFVAEKNIDHLIKELKKEKIKKEIIYLDEKLKRRNEVISELLSSIKLPQNLIDFIKENYKDQIDLLIQDIKKIKSLNNPEDIKSVISLQANIFKIQDLFLEKKWPIFIHYYKKFILEDKSKNKLESLRILSLLFSSLIKIFLIKMGLRVEGHQFYIQKLKEKAKSLELKDIKNLIFAIAKTDKKFKKFIINIKEIPEDIYLNYVLLQIR